MKIAIVKLSALGDIIQSAFVVQFIKEKIPDATIDWIVEEKFKDILCDVEGLNDVKAVNLHSIKKSFWNFFKERKKIKSFGEYDLIIDMQGLLKSAIVAKFLGKNTVGFDRMSARETLATFFYKKRFYIPYETHTTDRYKDIVSKALNIVISREDVLRKKAYMNAKNVIDAFKSQKKKAVFIIGSTWESRCYPKEKFVEVAKKIDAQVFIPYGNDIEYNKAKFIEQSCTNVTVLPKLTLTQLKGVIAKADLIVGNDTGPTYLGWANNIPTVILFGPTPPVRVYENDCTKLLKSPSKVDPLKLDKNDFSITQISVDEVVEAIKKVMIKKD